MIRKYLFPDLKKFYTEDFDPIWSRREFLEAAADQTILVFEEDGEVMGFIAFDNSGREIYITNIGVHLKYLRTGIGSSLISAVKVIRGKKIVLCWISELDLTMQLFLKDQQFRLITVDGENYKFCYNGVF